VRPTALLFDFNGTLSDDEQIQFEIYREIFGEAGRPLTANDYFGALAGLSDEAIVRTWIGEERPDLVSERVARYRQRAADGSTIGTLAREAVRYAAERAELAVVSGAARVEIDSVLAAADLADLVSVIVSAEDVEDGKPDPAGYTVALARLDREAAQAVAFEDSEAGVAAAKAAGLRCFALTGTVDVARLEAADEIVRYLDRELMVRILG
jgi:beta-phosphoglucomutase-like phosphatase (HAD superfamily)